MAFAAGGTNYGRALRQICINTVSDARRHLESFTCIPPRYRKGTSRACPPCGRAFPQVGNGVRIQRESYLHRSGHHDATQHRGTHVSLGDGHPRPERAALWTPISRLCEWTLLNCYPRRSPVHLAEMFRAMFSSSPLASSQAGPRPAVVRPFTRPQAKEFLCPIFRLTDREPLARHTENRKSHECDLQMQNRHPGLRQAYEHDKQQS